MVDQYLKKWAGLPKCATNAILHLDTALNIKKISTLFKEAHTVSHTCTRLKGDRKVNLMLANRLLRESSYSRKSSVTVEAEEIFKSAFGRNTVQGEIPGTTPEQTETGLTLSVQGEEGLELELTLLDPGNMEDLSPPKKFIEDVKLEAKTQVLVKESESI